VTSTRTYETTSALWPIRTCHSANRCSRIALNKSAWGSEAQSRQPLIGDLAEGLLRLFAENVDLLDAGTCSSHCRSVSAFAQGF
jgi:hypothetical protein